MAQSPIHITLSDEAAVEFVRSKVSSGEYASEADVVQQGLDALKDQAEERDRWEREVLIPAHDRLVAILQSLHKEYKTSHEPLIT